MLFKRNKLTRYYKKAKAMHQYREQNQVSDHLLRKEMDLYIAMAKIYDTLRFNKKYPHAALHALENYRAAADLGDKNAEYVFGERALEYGKFWAGLSNTIYQAKNHAKISAVFFEEAYAYFELAGKRGFAKANRMRGLMMINAWGTEKNTEQGLKLIVDSIEQEGAWDKATEIFGQLGLNKPEFFTAIMAQRAKQ